MDKKMVVPGVVASFTVALTIGCEGTSEPADLTFDRFPALAATEVQRIGSFDDPALGFTRIGGVDMDRDGNTYAAEAAVPEIRVFSPDGELTRRIGRGGEGPGEFQSSPRFGLQGDTIWAFDSRNQRITLFHRDGSLISARRTEGLQIPLPESYGHLFPWIMRPDGKFISFFGRISFNRDAPPTGVEPTDSIPFPFVLFDTDGQITDTVGWAPNPPPRMWRPPSEASSPRRRIQIDGRNQALPAPPTRLASWEQLSDGYIVVETPAPESPTDGHILVTRMGLTGDTVYSTAVHYQPETYSSEFLDSIANRAARGEPGGMAPYSPGASPPDNWRDIAVRLREEMSFPDFQIPIEYPWVSRDGSVWLRGGDATTATAQWFILDPDGRPRGTFELPTKARISWTSEDQFWAMVEDEFAVQWLVRYQIG